MAASVALAAIGLAPIVNNIAMADPEFSIDNSIHINEKCEHDCKYEGDIKQEGSIDYSESHDSQQETDTLNFYGKDLHGHKITFSVENIDTGAHLDYEVSNYDEYEAIFHWYDGKFPIGTSYTACLHDHKTDDQSCKTKSHQQNPDEVTVSND